MHLSYFTIRKISELPTELSRHYELPSKSQNQTFKPRTIYTRQNNPRESIRSSFVLRYVRTRGNPVSIFLFKKISGVEQVDSHLSLYSLPRPLMTLTTAPSSPLPLPFFLALDHGS